MLSTTSIIPRAIKASVLTMIMLFSSSVGAEETRQRVHDGDWPRFVKLKKIKGTQVWVADAFRYNHAYHNENKVTMYGPLVIYPHWFSPTKKIEGGTQYCENRDLAAKAGVKVTNGQGRVKDGKLSDDDPMQCFRGYKEIPLPPEGLKPGDSVGPIRFEFSNVKKKQGFLAFTMWGYLTPETAEPPPVDPPPGDGTPPVDPPPGDETPPDDGPPPGGGTPPDEQNASPDA